MMRWIQTVGELIAKEVRVEWRGKELMTLLLCGSVMTSVLVGAGVSSAILDARTTTKIFPMLLWIVFLLAGTSSVSRSSESELEGRGFEGLLLVGVSGAQMYIAKVVVTAVVFTLNFVVLLCLLAAVLDQGIGATFVPLLLVGCSASVALSALVVLLTAIASTSRLRGVLVPILALPLLFPLFFAAVEMTTQLVLYGALDTTTVWPSIVVCATTAYLLVGINLFETAIRD